MQINIDQYEYKYINTTNKIKNVILLICATSFARKVLAQTSRRSKEYLNENITEDKVL